MNPVEAYVVVITHVLAVPAILYWLVYRRVRWKDGATGHALMNKARSLALLIVTAIIDYWWAWEGSRILYAFALTYLTGAVTYQYHVMRQLVEHREDHGLVSPHPERTPT